ncbi:hypothetical protein V1506DRAFT_545196 [Lipomyces tetrasporus]
MAQLYDNMTYIDNDSIQNTGRPVFSVFVTGEPHLVTPRMRLEDRRYHKRHDNIDRADGLRVYIRANGTEPIEQEMGAAPANGVRRSKLIKRSAIMRLRSYFGEGHLTSMYALSS